MSGAFSIMLWNVMHAILQLLDSVQNAFLYLAGVKVEGIGQMNILQAIFNYSEGGSKVIAKTFAVFLIFSLAVFLFCFIVGIIKAQMNKDTPGMMKKTLANSIKASIFFFVVPLAVVFTLNCVSSLLEAWLFAEKSSLLGLKSNSICDLIFKTSMTDADGLEQIALGKINWDMGYNTIKAAGSGQCVLNYESGFNYFFGIGVSCVLLVSFLMATINLSERLINLIFLYFVSPTVVATSPLDDGARFNIWKDKILAKYLGVFGCVLSMDIYLMLANWAYKEIDPSGINAGSIAYFSIIIAGAFMCSKGSTLIAGLISHNEAQQDGMSQAASQRLAGLGMAAAGTVLGGTGRQARKMGFGGASASGGMGDALSGGSGGGGGFTGGSNRGALNKLKQGTSFVKDRGIIGTAGKVAGVVVGGVFLGTAGKLADAAIHGRKNSDRRVKYENKLADKQARKETSRLEKENNQLSNRYNKMTSSQEQARNRYSTEKKYNNSLKELLGKPNDGGR